MLMISLLETTCLKIRLDFELTLSQNDSLRNVDPSFRQIDAFADPTSSGDAIRTYCCSTQRVF